MIQAVLDPDLASLRTMSEGSTIAEITQEILSINEELKKIRDDHREVQDFENTISPSKLHRLPKSKTSLVLLVINRWKY